ncbi:MAG: hypothetical protein IT450_11060 [Phycisphaerales bacterium]|nr:hypothetical protein [Phycisphaerales bacterium]
MRNIERFRQVFVAFSATQTRSWVAALLALVSSAGVVADEPCLFTCGDFNGDGVIGPDDFNTILDCLGQPPGSSPECTCADMNGSGSVDLRDFATFSVLFGAGSDEVPPDCSGARAASANLTAYRPQHGAGYAPFARTAVSEAIEDDALRGPGIRLNQPGDADPAGEDDLVEVRLDVDPPGARLALRRNHPALHVWTTRNKQSGTEIAFAGDKTGVLPIDGAQTRLTLWVEWAGSLEGVAELHVESPAVNAPKDTLVFHPFRTIVVALGGEGQVPTDPPDPNHGTFIAARALYQLGYDVHMYDEDGVGADGTGVVFTEVSTAIRDRGVGTVAIFGYSHGGGSTYDLADLLDISRPALGVFEIVFTSYVDSVSNNSDFDTGQELRRPPSTEYHLNHYQHGSLFEDLGLDGGPVPDSNPPPTGLDVETTPWGANATHFQVDDFGQVLDLLESSLRAAIPQP